MKEVVFYVEGPSEQEFVKEVLGPYLNDRGIVWRPPILAANSTRKGRVARGGVRSYEPVRKDLLRLFRQFSGGPNAPSSTHGWASWSAWQDRNIGSCPACSRNDPSCNPC